MQKVTTESGAIYSLNGKSVRGGSLNIQRGTLLLPLDGPLVGHSMIIDTPERANLNPDYRQPSVTTTVVVHIEEMN